MELNIYDLLSFVNVEKYLRIWSRYGVGYAHSPEQARKLGKTEMLLDIEWMEDLGKLKR